MSAAIRIGWTTIAGLPAGIDRDLSAAERQRAGRFGSDSRRRQFIVSRSLLRALLEDTTGQPAAAFELAADGRGKPVCDAGPAVSIAHSGNVVVCAVAGAGDVGVDLEFPQGSRNTRAIAERYFTADEVEWLATQAGDGFYRLWVLKEAFLKATGAGIAGGLDRLGCTVSPPRIEARVAAGHAPDLWLYGLQSALLGVAAIDAPGATVDVRRWRPDNACFVADGEATLIAASRPAA